MVRKYEVIVKLRKEGATAEKGSSTERVLFTVFGPRPLAKRLASAFAFIIGWTVTDVFVRTVQDDE